MGNNDISCKNCKHFNLGAYHSGKWYCSSSKVSIFSLPPDMNKCFEKREGKKDLLVNDSGRGKSWNRM